MTKCQLRVLVPPPRPPIAIYLHVSILGCIMEGSPSPGVSHDGGTHEQKPVENRCVATPSCKVQGSGSFVILRCQANVCERDLVRESKQTAVSGGRTWGSHPRGGGTGALRAEVGLPSRDSQWAVEIPPGNLEAELARPTCPVTHVASQGRAGYMSTGFDLWKPTSRTP